MNRLFTQFRYGLEKKVVDLYLKAAIGSSGAPTLNADASKGVASIARNSAGKYTITLSNKYVDLLMVTALIEEDSGDPSAAGGIVLRSHTVASTKTIVIEAVDEAGSAIELNDGSTLRLKFELKATSV